MSRPAAPPSAGRVVATPQVGGLHHRDHHVAARPIAIRSLTYDGQSDCHRRGEQLRLRVYASEGAVVWEQERPNSLDIYRHGKPNKTLTRGSTSTDSRHFRSLAFIDYESNMSGLMLRGKFSEDHPIARGISDRGGLHTI